MKRMITILLAMLCLAGCAAPEAPAEQDTLAFTYNGLEIAPHADAAPVIEALGEPKSYTEETSCAFEGLDKTYYYGPFYLATYPMDGRDYVYTLWFADDTVTTAEGIRIGSPRSQVEEAYGTGSYNGTNSYVITKGQSRLVILITEETVSGVRYEGILD